MGEMILNIPTWQKEINNIDLCVFLVKNAKISDFFATAVASTWAVIKCFLGPFDPLGQPACFGAGCYIEMALSYHQPHQHVLVGGWKRIFGEKRAVAGRFFINPDDSKG